MEEKFLGVQQRQECSPNFQLGATLHSLDQQGFARFSHK